MVGWVRLVLEACLLLAFTMLSHVVEVTVNYACALFQFFRAAWPLSLVYGPSLQPPSPRTKKYVREVIKYLKRGNYGSSTEATTTEEEHDDQVRAVIVLTDRYWLQVLEKERTK
jgi:hypothetical protein